VLLAAGGATGQSAAATVRAYKIQARGLAHALPAGGGAPAKAPAAPASGARFSVAEAEALWAVVLSGNAGAVAAVLASRGGLADAPNANRSGQTALHAAAGRGHAAVIQALLAAGASPFARDRFKGSAPLHTAAACGHLDAVLALLEGGAAPDQQDLMQCTAFDVAMQRQSQQVNEAAACEHARAVSGGKGSLQTELWAHAQANSRAAEQLSDCAEALDAALLGARLRLLQARQLLAWAGTAQRRLAPPAARAQLPPDLVSAAGAELRGRGPLDTAGGGRVLEQSVDIGAMRLDLSGFDIFEPLGIFV
jgi:hypothetical protein